jgi:type I restriction enzyme, S subunit
LSGATGNGGLPELPGGWEWRRLGDLAEVIRGVTYKKHQAQSSQHDGYLPLLRATNINRDLTLSDFVFVPESLVKPAQRLRQDDIVVAISSGSSSVVGKAAALRVPFRGTVGTFCAIVRAGKNIDPSFLSWYMTSDAYRRRVSGLAAGSNINNLKHQHLAGLLLPYPPLRDQARIAAAIDMRVRAIEQASSHLPETREQTETLLRSILNSALHAGRERRLGDVVEAIEAGRSLRGHGHPAGLDEWGVIKVSAMTWGEFDPNENKAVVEPAAVEPRWEIRAGDLLLSRANTSRYVGASVLVGHDVRRKLLLSDKSLRLKVAANVDPAWLRWALSSPRVRREISMVATGTSDSMRNISQAKLKQLRLTVPPYDEQRRVAAYIRSKVADVRDLDNMIVTASARAAALRSSVVTSHLLGRVLVRPRPVGTRVLS